MKFYGCSMPATRFNRQRATLKSPSAQRPPPPILDPRGFLARGRSTVQPRQAPENPQQEATQVSTTDTLALHQLDIRRLQEIDDLFDRKTPYQRDLVV